MVDKFTFNVGDIPRERLEKPTKFIANHSTVLIYDNQPFASGTFVKCGAHFGILTAYHAIEPFNFKPNSPDQLGISISHHPHSLWIETH